MKHFHKSRALLLLLVLLYALGAYAQTNIPLPPACGSCTVTNNPSTNGTGIVSGYGGVGCTGSATINGSMTEGVAVSGVTMTLYANVTTIGFYNISAAQNGVTFSGAGYFSATGCQPITLTASGTPTAGGPFTWTTNTTPAGSATASVGLASNPSTNGTSIVSAYGGVGCTGSGTINGSMTEGVVVSGVTMTLYANVTQLGSWSLSSTNNGVTFSGSGTFSTLGCQAITLNAIGTPTATGPFTWNTNSTPAGSGTATVLSAFDPSTFTAGDAILRGKICFDIALSNDNTNACGALSGRTSNKSDFTLPAVHTQTYTFTPNGTVSNVRFYYMNDVGNAVVAISGDNAGNNITTAQATVNYNTNNNSLALGLTNNNPLTTRIFAVYNINATNNNNPADDRIVDLTAKVKDCVCCGAPTNTGGWLEFMCHNLGADYTADPLTPSWKLNGAYFQWGKKPVDTNNDGYRTKPNSPSEGFAAAPTGPGFDPEANALYGGMLGWNTTVPPINSWNVSEASPVKTANDPCPSGYRVPTINEWKSTFGTTPTNVSTNWTNVGNFQSNESNYTSGKYVNGTLFLPTAGYRKSIGELVSRGLEGYYWSSKASTSAAENLYFSRDYVQASGWATLSGVSIRCIAE